MKLARLALAVAVLLASDPVQGARPSGPTGVGTTAFGGGPGGGGTPTPPIGQAPIDPLLGQLNKPFFVRLTLVAESPRVVVLRSRDGRLIGIGTLTPGRPLLLPVPTTGALLDVLGSDAIGVPVAPGQQLTVVDGP